MTKTYGTSALKPLAQPTQRMTRKIGNTTYAVSISFSQTSKENINDKIMRLIRNEQQASNQ